MQFRKMRNAIYGPLVTIQYHAKCNDPVLFFLVTKCHQILSKFQSELSNLLETCTSYHTRSLFPDSEIFSPTSISSLWHFTPSSPHSIHSTPKQWLFPHLIVAPKYLSIRILMKCPWIIIRSQWSPAGDMTHSLPMPGAEVAMPR